MASSDSKQEKPGPKDVFAGEKPDANAQTRAKLEKLTKAEFADTPLSQVLDYFAHELDIQFHMDVKPLSEAGITPDTPVTFDLHNVPAEMILRWVLRDLGDITYYLDNGVIIVTTKDEACSRLETQVYRVDDLIFYPLAAKSKETTDGSANEPNKIYYDSLMELITGAVRSQTWAGVGGPGSISPYRGTLVISQTAEVHQEIQKLLKDLRKSMNPDIEDEFNPSYRYGVGGMSGSISSVESRSKESEKKDAAKPSPEKEKKGPKP